MHSDIMVMNKAVILNGKCVNAIVLPDTWTGSANEWSLPLGARLEDLEGSFGVGDLHDGSVWSHGMPTYTWDDIRAERNAKLAASDWMATQDRTMTQAEKAYRQALRDIPQTFGSPAEVVWP